MQPEFMCGGLAEDVKLEADPDKAEEEADAGKHQAVQLEAPPETCDARTPKIFSVFVCFPVFPHLSLISRLSSWPSLPPGGVW